AFKTKYLHQVKPFPGAHDILARTHAAGQTVVLASSASAEELEHYVGLLDAKAFVSETTSADDVENTKPAPDIFAVALKKIAPVAPEEVLVVGDTPYDVEAAAKCGIRTVALRSGKFADELLRDAGAIALYDDVAALLCDYDRSPLGETV
ncbi:MAG: HAD family hydrolase, partial [Zymomonas sp.]